MAKAEEGDGVIGGKLCLKRRPRSLRQAQEGRPEGDPAYTSKVLFFCAKLSKKVADSLETLFRLC